MMYGGEVLVKKSLNRIISTTIVLSILLLTFLLPFMAFGAIEYGTDTVPLLQEGDYDIPIARSSNIIAGDYNSLNDAQKNIYDHLVYHEDITFSMFALPNFEDFKQDYCNIINDFPEFYYVSSSFSWANIGSKVTRVTPGYSMSFDEWRESTTVFEEGTKKALSNVDDSMDDMQKALVLHDYILNNSIYADDEKDIAHSAWGFFYNGHVVCAGLTLVYSYLLHKVGIESEYVFTEKMAHAWNAVKINGYWYNVDLTFDGQTIYGDNPDVKGMLLHHWFMKSTKYFSSETGLLHEEFFTKDNCQMTDESYDDYWWTDIPTNILVIKGNYYYLKPAYSSNKYVSCKLTKRDKGGNESQVSNGSIYCTVSTLGMAWTDSNGQYAAVFPHISFGLLTYMDGKFFVTTTSKLNSIDFNGNTYQCNSIGKDVRSLYVKNNELYYQVVEDNAEYRISKKTTFNESYSGQKGQNYNSYADINNDGYISAKDYLLIKQQGLM